jgi:hypothetical protein
MTRMRQLSGDRNSMARKSTVVSIVIFLSVIISLFGLSAFSLEYATYIGGESWDEAYAVTVSQSGNVIATGITHGPTFPTTSGAYDETYNGELDVFVMVLTPDLSTLLGSTLVGGSEQDIPSDVTVDQSGNIVIVGLTYSSDFPTSAGVFDTTFNDTFHPDIFIIKLQPDLSALVASTYIGGEDWDSPGAVIIEGNEQLVVAGQSISENFPVTPGAFDTTLGVSDSVVFIMTSDLSELIASTFIGGESRASAATEVAIDEDGSIVICGATGADDYPTTPGAYDRTLNGVVNIVVSRLSLDLSELIQSTYIGGSEYDYPASLVLDGNGDVVVLGDTESPDFPSTSGAYDPTFNPHGLYAYTDLVLFRLSSDLSVLRESTFIGSGNSNDQAKEMCIDSSGNIICYAKSFNDGFPVTPDAFDTSFNGYIDAVLFVMSYDLSTLEYSTFLGGVGADYPRDLVQSGQNGIYVVGYTDADFPITSGAYDSENNFVDGFLAKFEFVDDVYPGLVVGPGPGEDNPPLVRTSGAEWRAYGVAKWGVNIACGDLDGDGSDEIVTGAGPGAVFGPHIRGWQSNGTALPGVNFLAYGTNKFGVNVAVGDIDGDGIDEILTGAGPGAVFGPHVRAWNVDGGEAESIPGVSYFAYGTLKWGVNVASGDIDGDGYDEIVTGAGPGAVFGPHVRGWNYDGSGPLAAIQAVSYFAYGTNKWGVNVACGDLDGDGMDEIITGAGPGAIFGPHVRGWNCDGSAVTPLSGVNYFAYPEGVYGAVVGAFDVDGDGTDEILTMPGPDPGRWAHARAWNVDGGPVTAIEAIDFFPFSDELRHGGRIAGGRFEAGSPP